VCYRCGANTHVATECRFRKEVCHKCGKRGHIQRACRAQQTQGPGRPSPRSRYQKSLHKLRLDWKTIKLLKSSDPSHINPGTTTQEKLKNLLDTYAEVFEDKLGSFKSAKARITLKEGSQPQFRKARQVPYSL
jgi:hypothetical protein